jgi:hypothetical protein
MESSLELSLSSQIPHRFFQMQHLQSNNKIPQKVISLRIRSETSLPTILLQKRNRIGERNLEERETVMRSF